MTLPAPHLVTPLVDIRQPSLSDLTTAVDDATDPLARLAAVAELRVMLDTIERASVEQARDSGAAWNIIGAQLGVTKQAAAKRFSPKPVGVVEPKPAAVKAPRPAQSWDVTTPGGRTLFRFVKQTPRSV